MRRSQLILGALLAIAAPAGDFEHQMTGRLDGRR
jgi:hypothetical protein